MTRDEHEAKFREIRGAVRKHGYRWLASPIYQDFLTGDRKLPCAPWGSITRNPYGWKGPCYLLTDGIFPTYEALLENIEWDVLRARKRSALRALRDPLRLRAVGRVRGDLEREGDRPEHGVDVDRATSPARRRGGAGRAPGRASAPHASACALRRGVPAGRLVSFGVAGGLDGLAVGTVIDATRIVDEQGAMLWEGARPRRRGRPGRERSWPRAGSSTTRLSGVGCTSARAPTPSTWRAACSPPPAAWTAAFARSATRPAEPLGPLAQAVTPDGRPRPRGFLRALAAPRPRGTLRALGNVRRALNGARGGGQRVTGRVLLAAPRSFCAGVDRAIEIVERLLEQHGPPIYVRHHIVHNDHVVRRLEELGAVFVDDEDEVPPGAICVLSAHGVAPAVRENCERRGLRVVDAVCPLVSKVHAEARRYADSGHLVALVGHRDHVEVIGTKGERPDQIVVVESPEEAARLETNGKPLAVISQTTLSLDDVASTVDVLADRFGDLRRPGADDICYATQNRQDAVKEIVSMGATLILVIGSPTSSNAQRLVEVARARGAEARLIEDENAIGDDLLDGHETVGLTAGASTPEELVQAVLARLAEDGYGELEEVTVAREDVHFRLPREVAAR